MIESLAGHSSSPGKEEFGSRSKAASPLWQKSDGGRSLRQLLTLQSQPAERGHGCSAHFLHLMLIETPAPGVVLSIFRVDLPIFVNPN